MGVFQSVKGRYFFEVGVLEQPDFWVSCFYFLASSCGKWCHHLSLGCGYLSMSCGHDPSGKKPQKKADTHSTESFRQNTKSILLLSLTCSLHNRHQNPHSAPCITKDFLPFYVSCACGTEKARSEIRKSSFRTQFLWSKWDLKITFAVPLKRLNWLRWGLSWIEALAFQEYLD